MSRAGRLSYALGIALGLAAAGWLFPWPFIAGYHALESPPPIGDQIQHIVGQRYFVADSWRWPLLVAAPLDQPHGTHIGFTDSIPLASLMIKAVGSMLPPAFQAVSLWLALSWALLPVAAIFAVRAAGERDVVTSVSVAVIVVNMPTLFWRTAHEALSSHFILLLALGLYFYLVRDQRRAHIVLAILLMVGSLLVHPYMLVMVVGMLAAAPVSLAVGGHPVASGPIASPGDRRALRLASNRWGRSVALGIGTGIAITGFVAWLLGYLGAGGAGGFGLYSMNLLSPIYPTGSAILRGIAPLDATGGQHEGYQYLGLGVVALCAVAVVLAVRGGRTTLPSGHVGLIAVSLLFWVLALSNQIYVGGHLILTLPYTVPQFQSSGRFFWPVAYAAILMALLILRRSMAPIPVRSILLAAALLQFIDLSTLRHEVRAQFRTPRSWAINAERLRPLLAANASLRIWPLAQCGPEGASTEYYQLLLLASERAMPVNTMVVARLTHPIACDGDPFEALGENDLVVFLPQSGQPIEAAIAGRNVQCEAIGQLVACVPKRARAGGPAGSPPGPIARRGKHVGRDEGGEQREPLENQHIQIPDKAVVDQDERSPRAGLDPHEAGHRRRNFQSASRQNAVVRAEEPKYTAGSVAGLTVV